MAKTYLGSVLVPPNKLEVLQQLVDNPDYQYSIRELADQCEASYGTVRKLVNQLHDVNVVTMQKKTNTYLTSYNMDNQYHDTILGLLRSRVEHLQRKAEECAASLRDIDGVRTIILFGSVAKGTATDESDIDLLVLTAADVGERVRRTTAELEQRITNSISPLTMAWDDFQQELAQQERFAMEVKQTGIILAGESPW